MTATPNRPDVTTTTTLGELISVLYDEYLAIYGDEDLASVAAAATINDILTEGIEVKPSRSAEAA